MRLKIPPAIAAKLVWSKPDSRIAPFCSLCLAHISDGAVPLMMWNDAGACVQFCDRCAGKLVFKK